MMEDTTKIKLERPQPALLTEYPFFYYGMTVAEFDEEQQYFMEFLAGGGKRREYKSLRQQREEEEKSR